MKQIQKGCGFLVISLVLLLLEILDEEATIKERKLEILASSIDFESRILKKFEDVYLYSAYPDLQTGVYTILAVVPKTFIPVNLTCSKRTSNGDTTASQALDIKMDIIEDGYKLPYDLAKLQCRFKTEERITRILVRNLETNISTTVKVLRPDRDKGDVALCVAGPLRYKGNKYPPMEMDLIGFIELQRLLGVDRIFLYGMKLSQAMKNLVTWYRKSNYVEFTPWTFPLDALSFRYFGQNLLMHDCLYRTRMAFNYTVFIDLDESVIPVKHSSLPELIMSVDRDEKYSWFEVDNKLNHKHWSLTRAELRNLYPGYTRLPAVREVLFLRRDKRLWEFGRRTKFLVRPDKVSKLDVHQVTQSLPGFTGKKIPTDAALLYHYRSYAFSMKVEGTNDNATVLDLRFHERFGKQIIKNVDEKCRKFRDENLYFCIFKSL